MTDPAALLDRIQYIQAELGSLAALIRLLKYDAPTPSGDALVSSAPVVEAPPKQAEVIAPPPAVVEDVEEATAAPARPGRARRPKVEVATPAPAADAPTKRGPGRPKKGSLAPATPARRKKAPATFSYLPNAVYRIVGDNPFRNGNNLALFNHLRAQFADRPFTRVQLGEEIARLQARNVMASRQPEQAIVIGFLKFAGIEKGRVVMVNDTAPVAEVVADATPREVKIKRRPRAGDAA